MKITYLLVAMSLLFTGCASISNFVKTQMAQQERLQAAVKNQTYELTIPEIRVKVVEYFAGWRSVTPNKRAQRIKEDIDSGFVYSGKYYQKYEPGLGELFGALSTQDKDYIKDFFTQTNFHTLVDNKETFKFVFDGMIFEAKRVDDTHTKLAVYAFSEVKHGPYKLDVNFLSYISKYGSLFTIRRGPVLMDESIKFARRDTMTEIDLLKTIDPKKYQQVSKGI